MNNDGKAYRPDRGKFIVFGIPTAIAFWFFQTSAMRYLLVDAVDLGIYFDRRQWLYAHIAGGAVALLIGPFQLWRGLNLRITLLHHILGVAYVCGIAVSATAAFYLAFHTSFGWVAGMGFTAMALAWTLSAASAVVAILRRRIFQHQEWMIRSYVITFSFVTFRVVTAALNLADIGTTMEQITAASWVSWSVPLLLTEVVLQGRKLWTPASVKSV